MIIMYGMIGIAILSLFTAAYADVWIPEESRVDFFDVNQHITIVGVVKSNESVSISPVITVYSDNMTKEFAVSAVAPHSEIPFKLKIMNISIQDIKLKLNYIKIEQDDKTISVIYNDTLIMHKDGRLTGRVVNYGNDTIRDVVVLALIHASDDSVLDMGRSNKISEIKPDQVINFTIYPENIIHNISYYSCFAIGDSQIIDINVDRKGQEYKLRYDSGIWFAYGEFNDQGNNLSLYAYNSWPAVMGANIEIPSSSIDEKFDISIDDTEIKHLQSIDEQGNWHLIFSLQPHQSGQLLISGFEDKDKSYTENISTVEINKDPSINESTKISKFESECSENREAISRHDGDLMCAFPTTISILIERGWYTQN